MVLCDHFRGFDRPKFQSLMEQLTALKMGSRDSVIVSEIICQQMSISTLLKGMPNSFV